MSIIYDYICMYVNTQIRSICILVIERGINTVIGILRIRTLVK